MELKDAERLAKEKLKEHGLKDWSFRFCKSTLACGRCFHSKKEITVARIFTINNTKEHVLHVILHEIAHALTGRGHDKVWKEKCIELGISSSRFYPETINNIPTVFSSSKAKSKKQNDVSQEITQGFCEYSHLFNDFAANVSILTYKKTKVAGYRARKALLSMAKLSRTLRKDIKSYIDLLSNK